LVACGFTTACPGCCGHASDVHDVFKCKQFGSLRAPLGSGLARFIAVLGFAERNAQPAFFRSWPSAPSAVKPANALPLFCWPTALQLRAF
jgi:hypothetical protein